MAKKYLTLSSTLKKLLFDRNLKPVDLARELNMPPPTIHRLITGKSTRPYQSSLKPIADFFSITIEELLGEKSLASITQTTKNQIIESNLRTIPILKWDKSLESAYIDPANKRIIVSNDINEKAFGLIMADFSMEPLFQLGSILIFDPQLIPHDRSYILAKLTDTNSYLFRQLLIDADHQYLKPLNPDLSNFKMKLLENNDKVLACLVESRFNFQSNDLSNQVRQP
jgi:SOS-response transcriptional repressor LexA